MKIFDRIKGFEDKVNFVDDNNVMLGYDMGQCCCEDANWFIANKVYDTLGSDTKTDEFNGMTYDLPEYNFDTSFFKQTNTCEFDAGGIAVFRITNGVDEKFIHLYNEHNGYYGHGFEFKVGSEKSKEGIL